MTIDSTPFDPTMQNNDSLGAIEENLLYQQDKTSKKIVKDPKRSFYQDHLKPRKREVEKG